MILVALLLVAAPAVRLDRSPVPVPSDSIPRRMDGSPDWSRILTSVSPAPTDTQTQRPRAVQYSDGYYRRLGIHRALSFAMIPLFAGSFITGNEMINNPTDPAGWAQDLHKPFAIGTAAVFGVNTVTGVWNLIESRKNPKGRTKRWIHSIAMIVADAGFTYTGAVLSDQAKRDPTKRDDHRNLALASMGLSVANWTFMLLSK